MGDVIMGYVSRQLKYVQRQLGNLVTFRRSSNDVPMLVFTAGGVQRSLCWMGKNRVMRMFTPYPGTAQERRDFTPRDFVDWFRDVNGLDRFNQTEAERQAHERSQVEHMWQSLRAKNKLIKACEDRQAEAEQHKAKTGTPFLSILDGRLLVDARFGAMFPLFEMPAPNPADPPLIYVEVFGQAYDVELLLKHDDWVEAAMV